jgi:hypothetical protein
VAAGGGRGGALPPARGAAARPGVAGGRGPGAGGGRPPARAQHSGWGGDGGSGIWDWAASMGSARPLHGRMAQGMEACFMDEQADGQGMLVLANGSAPTGWPTVGRGATV